MAKYKFDFTTVQGLQTMPIAGVLPNNIIEQPCLSAFAMDSAPDFDLTWLNDIEPLSEVFSSKPARDWQDVADCLRETLESFLGRKGKKCDKDAVNAALGILSREKGKDGVVHALQSLCAKKEIDPQLKSMFDKLAATVREEAEGVKKHVSRRTSRHKKGSKPGPQRSAERLDDLRRVYSYVQNEKYSVNKACEVVVAENKVKSDSAGHYDSAASLRDAYPGWREECRRAGKRT